MDDTAAAAAPGCDGDEPQPQEESTTAVASGCDASSPPSTSNPNPPSPDSSFMSGLEEDYDNNCFNDDFMQGVEIPKPPFVGDTEPLSSLAAEFQSGSPIIQEKIKLLSENYAALRRTRGDGNCFYRSFMFSYLEHILVTQDKAEVDRVLINIDQCKENLCSLGYAEFTYEDFFGLFIELLDSCLPGTNSSLSLSELLEKTRDQMISDCAVMFFRFITSAEMQKSAEFFEPFIAGLTNNSSVVQFCKAAVEPMGEESDHVHVTALSNALGVPIRVVYLDRSCDSGNPTINHHDFIPCANNDIQNNDSKGGTDATNGSTDLGKQEKPDPFVTLLYRPGHYDILYPM